MVNVTTGLNNLKTKVDDLDVDQLKSLPTELKKLGDLVSKEVVKKDSEQQTKYESKCFKKILDATNLVHINH